MHAFPGELSRASRNTDFNRGERGGRGDRINRMDRINGTESHRFAQIVRRTLAWKLDGFEGYKF
jgi:hypothetical protein